MTSQVYTESFYEGSYGQEVTYGTAITVDTPLDIHQNTVLTVNNNTTRYHGGAGIRDASHLILGKKEVRIVQKTVPQNGKVLQYFWGDADTSGSGPYTHVLDAYDGSGDEKDVPSVTMELVNRGRGSGSNMVIPVDGCLINDFTLSFAEESELVLDINWIAQDVGTTGTSITAVSRLTTEPYMFYHGVITVDGVIIANIQRGTFKANNNLFPHNPVTDTRTTAEPIMLQREYDLNLTFKTISDVHFDKLLAATNTGVTCTMVFTRGSDDTFTITTNNTVFNQYDLTHADKEAVVSDLAMIPKTASVTVVDSIATY